LLVLGDLHARIHGSGTPSSTSATESQDYDEVMPAVSAVMRTNSIAHHHHQTDEDLLQHPAPAHTPKFHGSLIPSAFTISAYAAPPTPSAAPVVPVMSLDELLRAYAVRKTLPPLPASSLFTSPCIPEGEGEEAECPRDLGSINGVQRRRRTLLWVYRTIGSRIPNAGAYSVPDARGPARPVFTQDTCRWAGDVRCWLAEWESRDGGHRDRWMSGHGWGRCRSGYDGWGMGARSVVMPTSFPNVYMEMVDSQRELDVARVEGWQAHAFIGDKRELGTSQANYLIATLAEAFLGTGRSVEAERTPARPIPPKMRLRAAVAARRRILGTHCPASESSTLLQSSPSSPTASAPMPSREPSQTLSSSSDSSSSESDSDSLDTNDQWARSRAQPQNTRQCHPPPASRADESLDPNAPSRKAAPFTRVFDLSSYLRDFPASYIDHNPPLLLT
ncbi:hypothetical protein DXG01_004116, partial [Tephrocybe rancida]